MTDPVSNGQPDWAALLEQATPRTKTVRLCLRGDLLSELADAEAAAETPSLSGESQDVTRLREQVAAASVEFTVRGITRTRYAALEAAHPDPKGEGWDMATFPEALVRESLVSPVVAPDQPLADVLTYGEFERLFTAAVGASIEVSEIPLPKRG